MALTFDIWTNTFIFQIENLVHNDSCNLKSSCRYAEVSQQRSSTFDAIKSTHQECAVGLTSTNYEMETSDIHHTDINA